MRSNLILELILSLVCVYIFWFRKKKNMFRKMKLVQDLIPPLSIYIHMCTLYTHPNICMPRFSPSEFFGPPRCTIPTPGLTPSTPCVQCVCVCAYTHTCTHIHSTRVQNGEDADNTPIFPSVENNPHAKRQTVHRRGFRVWAFLP